MELGQLSNGGVGLERLAQRDPAELAGVYFPGDCQNTGYSGYTGLDSVQDLQDATTLTYTGGTPQVMFGTHESNCNMGLLVFKYGNQYGVIDFIDIDPDNDYSLTFEYWLANPGIVDFSDAPNP